MPRTLQFRRYNAETLANTVGANGELIINTTNKTLTVHDGVLPGGYALLNSATDNNIDNYARTTANAATAVNLTQNNSILNATNLAQAAYNRANTANGGGSITGNISISSTNSAINFVANSSGDGYGYSTLELVPDTNVPWTDQKIIIDPTAPNHIHIRAGGQQDSSQADLFLGGEKNYVRVKDNEGIRLQNEELNDNYYYYAQNIEYISGTWYEESGNYFIQFTTDNAQMVNHLSNFAAGSPNEVFVYWDPGSGVISNTMTCTNGFWQGIGNVYTAQVNSTLTANNTVLTAIEFHLFTTQTNFLRLENNDFTVDVADDVRINARDIFSLRNWSTNDPIEIITDYDANSWTWSFNTDKTLRVPGAVNFQQNSTIPLGPPVINGTNDRVRLWDFEGGGTGFNYAIGAEGNHVWFSMDVNNGTGGFKFYSRDNQVFKIRDDGALLFADGSIQTMAANTGNVTFNDITIRGVGDEYGGHGLYLSPDPALAANLMYFRIRGGDIPTHLHFDTGDGNIYDQYFGDDGKYLKLEAGNQGNVIIGVNGTGGPISWQFNNNGTLTFSDSTTQNTAWAGGRVVSIPTHSTGASNDKEGDLAFSNGYIYYCTADYGQIGHQVSVATDYTGATVLNTNNFQFTKTSNTIQIAAGDIISDSDGGPTSVVYSVYSDDNYTYVSTGATAYYAVFPLTFTSTNYVPGGNIWKRIAWSGDTW